MLLALAQSTMPELGFPRELRLPEIPTQNEIVDYLIDLSQSQYGAIMAMLLVACGLVYMLQGWKIFKILVVINAAVLGAAVGGHLGTFLRGPNTWLYTSVGGGVLLAVMAGPLMNYAVSLMGGLAGSFLGYAIWTYVANTFDGGDGAQYAWVGALIGLISLGLLAFVILQAVVTILTALQGAIMAVTGIATLLIMYEPTRQSLEGPLRENTHLAALVVGVPAVIGIAFQYAGAAKKAAKKKKGDG